VASWHWLAEIFHIPLFLALRRRSLFIDQGKLKVSGRKKKKKKKKKYIP
jgi:hypothetical protein